MLDIGWTELMVIGVIALLVVGPKELPRLLRTVGQFVGKARGMARDFQRSMEDAAREADLKELTDLKRDVDKMSRVSFQEQAKRSASSLTSPAKKTAPTPGAAEAKAGPPAESPAAPPAEAESPPAPKPEPEPEPKAASGER
ncbi:MAG TPA: Sec-independent protein translocase protein TatB [Thermohalobaculum sp.]|nr:Sec-independent protein translocase protein TatB [Thermohalobaculum sp.]